MTYFVTGATGFIGRHLLERLLERKGTIHCLVRKESLAKFKALCEELGADEDRLVAVVGDLAKPKLGVAPATQKALGGKIKHVFHLAALYDLAADEASQVTANVEGTRHALEFADAIKAGCFHHVSSIAAAGLYSGVFREDMKVEVRPCGRRTPIQGGSGEPGAFPKTALQGRKWRIEGRMARDSGMVATKADRRGAWIEAGRRRSGSRSRRENRVAAQQTPRTIHERCATSD